MEEKIRIRVIGLAPSKTPPNAFIMFLSEINGDRCIPIIIGPFEAQAIAEVLERSRQVHDRPMTHDLFVALLEEASWTLQEVFIREFDDDTFYCDLVFADTEGDEFVVDSRPSDAIAIALRCNSPVYVSADIFDERGVNSSFNNIRTSFKNPINDKQFQIDELTTQLERAVRLEEYETAAKLRDMIQSLLDTQ